MRPDRERTAGDREDNEVRDPGRVTVTEAVNNPVSSQIDDPGSSERDDMVQKRRSGRGRGPRPRRSFRQRSYKGVCAECGTEVLLQVPPPEGRKLLCVECFKKH